MVRRRAALLRGSRLATRPRDDAIGRGTPGRLPTTPIGAPSRANIGHIAAPVQPGRRKKSRERIASRQNPADAPRLPVAQPRHCHACTPKRSPAVKLVIAVIKPHKLEDVRDALAPLGIAGMTVTEARGYGRQKGHAEIYRGAEYTTNLLPKAKLEIMVDDTQVDQVVDAIQRGARTGRIGDGKIFVTDLARALRIRTGETQSDAL
jgi:nitrogen regulatory protein PII